MSRQRIPIVLYEEREIWPRVVHRGFFQRNISQTLCIALVKCTVITGDKADRAAPCSSADSPVNHNHSEMAERHWISACVFSHLITKRDRLPCVRNGFRTSHCLQEREQGATPLSGVHVRACELHTGRKRNVHVWKRQRFAISQEDAFERFHFPCLSALYYVCWLGAAQSNWMVGLSDSVKHYLGRCWSGESNKNVSSVCRLSLFFYSSGMDNKSKCKWLVSFWAAALTSSVECWFWPWSSTTAQSFGVMAWWLSQNCSINPYLYASQRPEQ